MLIRSVKVYGPTYCATNGNSWFTLRNSGRLGRKSELNTDILWSCASQAQALERSIARAFGKFAAVIVQNELVVLIHRLRQSEQHLQHPLQPRGLVKVHAPRYVRHALA